MRETLLAGKRLCRQDPYQPEEFYPWDAGIVRRFHLDSADIESLESDETLFVGYTAFYLEDESEAVE